VLVWEEDGWGLGPQLFPLIAIQDYAWYWVQESPNPAAIGATVTASVGSSECGVVAIMEALPGFSPAPRPIGFARLAVPSNAVRPGCGRSGATVTFAVGGLAVTANWEPGLHRLDLPLDAIQPTPSSSPTPIPSVAPTQTPEPSAAPTSTPSAAATPAAFPSSGGRQGVPLVHSSITMIILAAAILASVGSAAVWHRLR
jgi:hypothetical protein